MFFSQHFYKLQDLGVCFQIKLYEYLDRIIMQAYVCFRNNMFIV